MKAALVLVLFFTLGLTKIAFGQQKKNVYLSEIQGIQNDTARVNRCLEVIQEISDSKPDQAIEIGLLAEKSAQKTGHRLHHVYSSLAVIYIEQSDFKHATDYSFKLLKRTKQLNGNERYDYEGRAKEQLAKIHKETDSYEQAIKYQREAIASYKRIPGDNSYILAHINLANYYLEQDQTQMALSNYRYVERRLEKEGLSDFFPYIYNGIAICYQYQGHLTKAIRSYEQSKQAVMKYTPDDLESLAIAYNNIGNLQNETNEYEAAAKNLSEALHLFEKTEDWQSVADVSYNIAISYQHLKLFEKSNEHMMKYVSLRDSIFDQETKRLIQDLSIKYESEKKEQKNKLLAKDLEKKQQSIYFALAGLGLVLLVLFMIFRNYRQQSRTNRELASKNQIIEEKSSLVAEQNKDIKDSIQYAERIQRAILPQQSIWENHLPNSFVFYCPKDILSGDFYWIESADQKVYVAAADCTGHGVPGALVSIVNYNLLNKAVKENGLRDTALILDDVNEGLYESLNRGKSSGHLKDGMDINLIALDRKHKTVQYSGANNPLYLIREGEVIVHKANKFPVGYYMDGQKQQFDSNTIPLKEGDMLYLFTDGYADQFGGPGGKKFKYRQLRDTFLDISGMELDNQHQELEKRFKNWKGNLEQIDDVLIIGIKI
ncbi:MAG: tetratricopeptide repeat protein [Bacteroidetes bacterium]|nr:MAG: tetratricopeptide repeat protein [Bacteroidota bacterium]